MAPSGSPGAGVGSKSTFARVMIATAVSLTCPTAIWAQDPALTLPRNYQTTFENNIVQVVRVRYEAHEKLPLHDHSQRPTVYVYLSDSGPVRFSHLEEHPFALTRRPVRMGDFRVSPGRIEKHEVENLGNIPTEFLRVELKRVALGLDGFQFRGNKGFDLARSGITAEFASTELSIQRCIVTRERDAHTLRPKRPTLLIALAPTLLRSESGAAKQLQNGDIYWLDANQPARVEKTEPGPAHILAITFLR